MIVNHAVKLGVLSRGLAQMLESTLIGLQWGTFEAWLWCNRGNILRALRQSQIVWRQAPAWQLT